MTNLLARHQKHKLSCMDHMATAYQYMINLMAYYPEKTAKQLSMLTYLQLVDCMRATGKIRIVRSVLQVNDDHYKAMVDRHSPT